MSSAPTYPVAPTMPTLIRLGPPSALTPRWDLGRIPDERSVAIAAGDSSPVLTGTPGRSRAAGADGSPGSDGPSSWEHDYTGPMHSHARAGSTRARVVPDVGCRVLSPDEPRVLAPPLSLSGAARARTLRRHPAHGPTHRAAPDTVAQRLAAPSRRVLGNLASLPGAPSWRAPVRSIRHSGRHVSRRHTSHTAVQGSSRELTGSVEYRTGPRRFIGNV